MTLEALRETAKTMGVPLTEAQMDQFKLYLEDLLLWN
jgi:16S rRNA G527 N7-methylase RsmG